MKEKIAILGGGNIGKAIVRGLLASGKYPAENLVVTDLNLHYLDDLREDGINLTTDNNKAVRASDIVILCVQPTQVTDLIAEIKDTIDPGKQIIAYVVAAYEISDILELIGKPVDVVRVMPNTAIAIRESMTCLATHKGSDGALEKVRAVFEHLGSTMVIREELMGAATILGACGIAYFLRYIRAASQGGIQVGFHADEAQIIAAQTARGAASLLLQSGNHPEDEIDKVTTPRGCTIAGLNEMEHFGLSSAVIKGIITSYNEIEKLK
ncbi:MAG: pyrroline-5-carboxylate reductase [Bacteroides sp. SM23_62]|nr:MAG: pyrroline-5-carboxylate reductase [Bacteroides sp. SM23_62]